MLLIPSVYVQYFPAFVAVGGLCCMLTHIRVIVHSSHVLLASRCSAGGAFHEASKQDLKLLCFKMKSVRHSTCIFNAEPAEPLTQTDACGYTGGARALRGLIQHENSKVINISEESHFTFICLLSQMLWFEVLLRQDEILPAASWLGLCSFISSNTGGSRFILMNR